MFRRPMVLAFSAWAALTACAPAEQPPAQPPAQPTQQPSVYLQYAQCMRDNGVEVPDPRADDPGAMYDGVDTASPAFENADRTCGAILADVMQERQEPDPEQLKHQQEELLALARCLREQGIEAPDPVPGQAGGAFGPGLDRTDPGDRRSAQSLRAEMRTSP